MLEGVFLVNCGLVEYNGNGYVLVRAVDLDTILARNLAEGETKLLPILNLRPPSWPEGIAWRQLLVKNYRRPPFEKTRPSHSTVAGLKRKPLSDCPFEDHVRKTSWIGGSDRGWL